MKTNYKTTTFLAILMIVFSVIKADTYHSTDDGGRWHSDTTWVEGIIPGPSDDVIISSGAEVVVFNNQECNNLTVENIAIIRGRSGGNRTLDVYSNVLNNGTVTNGGAWQFIINIKGDIENYGSWDAYTTKLSGSGNHSLSCGVSNSFSGYNFIAEATTGSITALTDIIFTDSRVNLNGITLELDAGLNLIKDVISTVYIQNAVIIGNDNSIYLENGAYLIDVDITAAVLEGKVLVRGNTNFYGNIVVEDTLSNPSGVNSTLDVFGPITNNGIIKQAGGWYLIVYCFDNVINNGTWENDDLRFGGSTAQTITCLNDHYFSCEDVKDTSSTSNSPLVAGTKINFIGSTINLNWGELNCNNNEIYLSGGARMNEAIINNALIGGEFVAGNNIQLNGITEIKDTLTSPGGYNSTIIDGDLVNNGRIVNGGYGLTLNITGDVENNGDWITFRTNFTGTETQYLSMEAGKEFVSDEFNDTDITAPLEAQTNLSFSNSILNMNGGEMIFPVTKGLTLSLSDGGISNGTYTMNNGTIFMENDAQVNTNAIISDVSITGKMILFGANIVFEGEIINQDTLQSQNSYTLSFTIDGNITNNGLFLAPTSNWNNIVFITGNITNNGEWLRITTHLSGTGPHEISQTMGKEFYGKYFYADTGTGTTTVLTGVNFNECRVSFNDEELVLEELADLKTLQKIINWYDKNRTLLMEEENSNSKKA